MSELPDDMIKEIAARVAKANSVSVSSVQTSSTVDSSGSSAIEIKFVLTPGSSAAIMGLPSALTTSQVIQRLADAGEERLPIGAIRGTGCHLLFLTTSSIRRTT